MPNWNPLTNAIGGGGATPAQTYYTANPSNYGEYEYIYVSEAVDNFMAAYVGEGKILANVLREMLISTLIELYKNYIMIR